LTEGTLTIWDSGDDVPEGAGQVYLWNGYGETDSVHSVLQYVEIHSERLRGKYLSWIHELGEHEIQGTRVIDALMLENGFSYWWMTLLFEKSLWKSPSITDAIRALALEEIVEQRAPREVLLVSRNRRLNQVILELCRTLGIQYRWEEAVDRRPWRLSLRALFIRVPMPLRAIISIIPFLSARWGLRGTRSSAWFGGERSVFFCSYFFNIDFDQTNEGRFRSRYWGNLHAVSKRKDLRANWLQLYLPHADVPTAAAAVEHMRRFNQYGGGQEFHTFVEAYLSWSIVVSVLKRWLALNAIYRRLTTIEAAFRPKNSRISLWPLLQRDWEASMRGAAAVISLLWIELFDRALGDAPRQDKGFYLCENQGWERAFIHAWRKHGHGELIAVPHATVRFWDLRYFADPRTLRSVRASQVPQPDCVALNGPAAVSAYLSVDFPRDSIRECEALRYTHANPGNGPTGPASPGDTLRVLILTDLLPASTNSMLTLLEAASSKLPLDATYTVKPHPYFMIDPAEFESLRLNVTTEPLEKILPDFAVAYSANMTSAALDAYLAGLEVIVMLDGTQLNLSPLRGQSGVTFVSTPEELAAALDRVREHPEARAKNSDYFFLDPELPRWSRLLS